MTFLSNDKFITSGLRVLGGALSLLSVICIGMWLYAVFFDTGLEELERSAVSSNIVGFIGFGAIGFFLLALARLVEIGQKIVEK
jgi:predicted permease